MKISLYFIFYIAMIMELLMFIAERDDATSTNQLYRIGLEQLADSLAERYARPIALVYPPHTRASLMVTTRRGTQIARYMDTVVVIVTPAELWSEEEKRDIRYVVLDDNGNDITYRAGYHIRIDSTTGRLFFSRTFTQEGNYRYRVRCEVRRTIPAYYPEELRSLIRSRFARHTGWTETFSETDTTWTVRSSGDHQLHIDVRAEGVKVPPCPQCGF